MFTVVVQRGAYELLHYPSNGWCIMTRRPSGDKDGMWKLVVNGPLTAVMEKWNALNN